MEPKRIHFGSLPFDLKIEQIYYMVKAVKILGGSENIEVQDSHVWLTIYRLGH